MKKGFLKILFLISFLVIASLPKNVFALTFKVEKSIDTIKPGKDVTVYVKATDIGSEPIEKYTINLAYDGSKLNYKSSSSSIAKVNATNPIVITNNKGTIGSDTTIATIVFTAKSDASAGDANLTLSSSDATTTDGNKISATNTSSMVKVAAFSSDATLSSLKIPNATISPKFDKNVTEYKSTIQDITEITVTAIASDSNSKIMISDNYKNLQKGDNDIKITVTAEDGRTTKTYTIKVTLKMTPTDEEVLKANAALKDLKVDDYDLEFTKELKKYSLTVPYKIKSVNLVAEPENEKAKVVVEGDPTKLIVGRNVFKVVVTSEDEKNTDTYTLTVTRAKEEKKVVQTCPDTTSTREWILFSVCMFVTFTLGIILGYFLCKKEVLSKIFRKKEKMQEQIDEQLSNTIEVVNPNIKKN